MAPLKRNSNTPKPEVSPAPLKVRNFTDIRLEFKDLPSGFRIDFIPTPLQEKGCASLLIHPDDLEKIKNLRFNT